MIVRKGTPEEVVAEALEKTAVLNGSQRRNVWAKVEDMREGRLLWESVPFRVILESNRRCNISCFMCENVRPGNGELPRYLTEKLFDEIGWGCMEIQPFGAGEPTLSPMEFLAPLARRHNQYFNFITNGVLFTRDYYEAVADRTARVQFSLHSIDKRKSERISRGQDWDVVVRNMRDTVEVAAETGAHVLSGMVVMNQNFDEIPDYIRFMGDMGIKRVLLSKLYPTSSNYAEDGIELFREASEIRALGERALEVALEYGIYLETNLRDVVEDPRNHPHTESPFDLLHENAHLVDLFRPETCISTSITVFVEWDGTVLPCFQHRIPLGNLYEQSFEELWNGDVMRRHRESFLKLEPQEFCANCQAFFCDHA